jgi:hypothetical protein
MAEETKPPEATSTFDPKGKSFAQRVDAFIADVKEKHKIIITKDNGRTATWQQKHHVAHMFLYNKYKSTTPAKTDSGERTISWAHFSDAKVNWDTIDWKEFLKTAAGDVPKKSDGKGWAKGFEPDKEKTKENVKSLLTSAGIGNSGQAMVSAGLAPCGEPCKCGAGRSNHLDDSAADLASVGLIQLEQKLEKEKSNNLDSYLKEFGLHRPLLNHPESPEKWHVEALADTKF